MKLMCPGFLENVVMSNMFSQGQHNGLPSGIKFQKYSHYPALEISVSMFVYTFFVTLGMSVAPPNMFNKHFLYLSFKYQLSCQHVN